jgi:CRP-like cAMP-binding protein
VRSTALAPASDIASLLKHNHVLKPLPQVALSELAAAATLEHFTTGALLNAAGQPLGKLRLVVRGHVEIIARHVSGAEVALGDVGPGGWATWVGCFSPHPPDHDFTASADSTFVALPTALVRELARRHPELYPSVIADLGVRMRQLMEWTGESVLLGPEQRMAKLIHLLSRLHGTADNRATLLVTQARLASLARCSRQSANQLVGALERRGLIEAHYGRFEITDMAALLAFVESDQALNG